MTGDPLLSVEDLSVQFRTAGGVVRAVDGVSFTVDRGETVCLVGESGSGKTVACEAITRLEPGADAVGRVVFDGRDLTRLDPAALREVRGARIAHVFQNPQGALDPLYTVGEQVAETVRLHGDGSAARDRAIDLLDRVGIPDAAVRVDDYPHEFSGGMKQRVVLAVALAADPDLLVADEPTTALDVTVEASILRLLADLQAEFGMAVLFVTHDLGVVAEIADRVVVFYAGRVMERGTVAAVFERPAHPYTQALFRCLPGRGGGMEPIGGSLPDPTDPPDGCRFHTRCPHAVGACRGGDHPPLHPVDGAPDHRAACVFYGAGYDAATVRDPDESAGTEGGGAAAPNDAGAGGPGGAIDADAGADAGADGEGRAGAVDTDTDVGEPGEEHTDGRGPLSDDGGGGGP